MRFPWWAIALFLGIPLGGSAVAQPAALDEDRGWPAGPASVQLDGDPTLVPFGKGAVFVPAMNNPLDEPPVTVWKGAVTIAEGTTGQRIVLSPGTYEVRLGSGADVQRLRYQASVREGHTSVIPVSWAGLSIHVVDEQYGSLRASYELIRVEDRQYMGVGFGTDEQAGEPVTTWILRPGLYKIVRLGDTYRARRDFATVRLLEGNLTHFLLVLNGETGAFAGAGEVPEEELFRPQQGFFGSLVLGGDVSFNQRSNVPGLQDGLTFAFRAFADARMSLGLFGHPLILQLQVEEGQAKAPDLPLQKNNDRVDLDLLYIYRLERWLGPYVRFGVETNFFSGFSNFDRASNVAVFDLAGDLLFWERGVDRVKLSPPLGLTSLKEGTGLNVRVFKSRFAEGTLRTGVGARHRLAKDLFEEVEISSLPDGARQSATFPPLVAAPFRFFREIGSDNQVGVEVTILGTARLSRWVLMTMELDALVPFDTINNTVLEARASVAFKLTSYLSINYVFRFLRDRAILPEDRLEQDVLLRFSLELF